MNDLITAVVIVGASVSSGFSGKPSGEIVAEQLRVPYRNEARACQALTDKNPAIPKNSLVVNLDGSYWDSYAKDCKKPVEAVKEFYMNALGSRVVVATVPNRNAGGFYRFFCGPQTAVQGCRVQINEAITKGCTGDCILLDAEEMYAGREKDDIHLSPEDWKRAADRIVEKIK